jgi:predicted helicase
MKPLLNGEGIRKTGQEMGQTNLVVQIEKTADFWSFSKADRELAELHLDYEDRRPPKEVEIREEEKGIFDIEKMCFGIAPGKYFGERIWNFADKTTIFYNAHINISNIPAIYWTCCFR